MKDKLKKIMDNALAQIEESEQLDKLNDIKVSFLGKKGELTSLLKSMKDIAPEDRPKAGQMVNEARTKINEKLEAKKKELSVIFGTPTATMPAWLAKNLVLAKEYGVLDRVMFASDYVAAGYDLFSKNPANDLKAWIHYLKEELNQICERCGWPLFEKEEIEGILGKNAAALYL